MKVNALNTQQAACVRLNATIAWTAPVAMPSGHTRLLSLPFRAWTLVICANPYTTRHTSTGLVYWEWGPGTQDLVSALTYVHALADWHSE